MDDYGDFVRDEVLLHALIDGVCQVLLTAPFASSDDDDANRAHYYAHLRTVWRPYTASIIFFIAHSSTHSATQSKLFLFSWLRSLDGHCLCPFYYNLTCRSSALHLVLHAIRAFCSFCRLCHCHPPSTSVHTWNGIEFSSILGVGHTLRESSSPVVMMEWRGGECVVGSWLGLPINQRSVSSLENMHTDIVAQVTVASS